MFKANAEILNFSFSFTHHIDPSSKTLSLSHKSRWFVYILFLLANILISLDHGSIPASTHPLRKIAGSDQALGLFGSLVFVGNIIGSLISFWLINVVNRKTLLLLSLTLLSLCLFTFVLFTNIFFLFINRILVGIFQSYVTIYLPVWCDQFGMLTKKSLMITFGQLVVPIGVFLGYLIASVFINANVLNGWKVAFVIQGIGVILLSIVFIFIPRIYFHSTLYRSNTYTGSNYHDETVFTGINIDISNHNNTNNNNNFISIASVLFQHKVFLYAVLSLSSLFYVITGVQYWVSDYMDNILHITSTKQRLLYFTIVCFTSPTFGVFLSGFVLTKIGGYEHKHSITYSFVLAFIAGCFAVAVPLVNDVEHFVFLLWLVLFFGGGVLPVITGIIISCLPKHLAASGNSFTILIGNLFGYLPAPYIYGMFTDVFKDKGQIGMVFTMWYSFVGVAFMGVAAYYRYRYWEREGKGGRYCGMEEEEGLILAENNEMKEQLLNE